MIENCGEISPQLQEVIKTPIINSCNEYIVDFTDNPKECGEIPPETDLKEGSDKLYEKQTWFQNPVNCISKWSKALKMGAAHTMGLDHKHITAMDSGENDKLSFSFFL